MGLGASIRSGWLFLIGHSLNRLTSWAARHGSRHFSIVHTVGRRTGLVRETPIIVRPIEGGFVVELTYGPDVNWHRNALAAGGCTLIVEGVEHTIVGVEPLSKDAGLAAFPMPERLVLTLLRRKHFEKFVEAR